MSILRNIKPEKLDLYMSIDELPIYNWWKINETNDLTWLLKQRKEVSDAKQVRQLADLWDKLFDEFIDTFGVPKRMRKVLMLRRDIICLENEIVLTGEKHLKAIIKMRTIDLIAILNEEKAETGHNAKVWVKKSLPFQLNERTTAVKEWYEYAEAAAYEANEKIKAANKGHVRKGSR